MKDEHIYSPSFKKQVLEKIGSLKEQFKLPSKKAKVIQSVELRPKPTPVKVVESPAKETLTVSVKQTVKTFSKVIPNQPNKPQIKKHLASVEKTIPKSHKFKMTREAEEKILVFTLLFSVVSIILLGIFISYFNAF